CSLASPLLASACAHSAQRAVCHGVPAEKPHCEMAHHGHAAATASRVQQAMSAVDQQPSHCPMGCCLPGHRQGTAVVAGVSYLPLPALTTEALHFVAPVFVSTGFSSHTDRGPPSI